MQKVREDLASPEAQHARLGSNSRATDDNINLFADFLNLPALVTPPGAPLLSTSNSRGRYKLDSDTDIERMGGVFTDLPPGLNEVDVIIAGGKENDRA